MSVGREMAQLKLERDAALAALASVQSDLQESQRLLRLATGLLRDHHRTSGDVAKFLAGKA